MADEDLHGDLVVLILIFVAAVLLAVVVWLLMRKYRMEQMKSFECTPPKLASPIATPLWDSSLLLAMDQLRQQPTRTASIQEQSASATRFTSTAADTSQANMSKSGADDNVKAALLEPKDQPRTVPSGSTVLRDSKGTAKRSAKSKDTDAGRKKNRRSSTAVREKSLSAPTKRRSKHRRPEPFSPEVFKTAPADKLSVATAPSPPHKESAKTRATLGTAFTTAVSPPAAPASPTGAGVRRNPATAAGNAAQVNTIMLHESPGIPECCEALAKDHPRKTSPDEELSPVSAAAASARQATTSPEAGEEENFSPRLPSL
ncbi:uncharacterized protein LOC144101702 [Amblyomma americanum]